jgi:hypothetical protein
MLIVCLQIVAVVVVITIVPLLWEKAAIWAAIGLIGACLQWRFVRIVK